MKLAIVAYPRLADADREWIEAFRARHDPQASRLPVHFTLVFPFDATVSGLEPETQEAARSTPPIHFVIRDAEAVPDALSSRAHVFLVPNGGGSQMRALHRRLYSGCLRSHLRDDIPFVPHMTIGTTADARAAADLAAEAGARCRMLRGTLSTLDVVDVGEPLVRTVVSYTLGPASPRV